MTDALICLCTCPTKDVACALAVKLVEARCAACVNVVPDVRSIYRWQDKVFDDAEVLLIIKTTTQAYPALADLIRAEHPYELPELVAVSVDNGSAPYLSWLSETTTCS